MMVDGLLLSQRLVLSPPICRACSARVCSKVTSSCSCSESDVQGALRASTSTNLEGGIA